MVDRIKLIIPMRPVPVNQAYRSWNGRIIKSKKAREFQKEASEFIREQETKMFIKGQKLKVIINVDYKTKRQVDVDSCLKLLLDTLEGTVMENDNQIYDLHVKKRIGCKENLIKVKIQEIKEKA